MSHPDRHEDCGGLWVGGVRTQCQTRCSCEVCSAYAKLADELVGLEAQELELRDAD